MSGSTSKIQLLHPDPKKTAPRVDLKKYNMVKNALIEGIPEDENGIPFMDLFQIVEDRLSKEELQYLGSLNWYTTTVKLDLEARGIIERIPGSKPQRVRNMSRNH